MGLAAGLVNECSLAWMSSTLYGQQSCALCTKVDLLVAWTMLVRFFELTACISFDSINFFLTMCLVRTSCAPAKRSTGALYVEKGRLLLLLCVCVCVCVYGHDTAVVQAARCKSYLEVTDLGYAIGQDCTGGTASM